MMRSPLVRNVLIYLLIATAVGLSIWKPIPVAWIPVTMFVASLVALSISALQRLGRVTVSPSGRGPLRYVLLAVLLLVLGLLMDGSLVRRWPRVEWLIVFLGAGAAVLDYVLSVRAEKEPRQ
jgi:phosphatidylglycerophosphate synthase